MAARWHWRAPIERLRRCAEARLEQRRDLKRLWDSTGAEQDHGLDIASELVSPSFGVGDLRPTFLARGDQMDSELFNRRGFNHWERADHDKHMLARFHLGISYGRLPDNKRQIFGAGHGIVTVIPA